MKIITLVVVLFVFCMSLIGSVNNMYGIIKNYHTYTLVRFVLSILGLTTFVLFVFKKKIYTWLCVIWFLPQMLVVRECILDIVHEEITVRAIYDTVLGWKYIFYISRTGEAGLDFQIGVNIVAITGWILALVLVRQSLPKIRYGILKVPYKIK